MAFRINSPIDSNQHKGLLGVNSITGSPLAITGLSLTNAQPIHVAVVDGVGSQITAFGNARATGGYTPVHYISAATTNATSVKASSGVIGGIQAYNNAATIGYLKLYDKASAPTVGSDTPVATILIPASASSSGAGTNINCNIQFTTGIAFAITGALADADTTAVAASAFVINLDYI